MNQGSNLVVRSCEENISKKNMSVIVLYFYCSRADTDYLKESTFMFICVCRIGAGIVLACEL